MAIGMFSFISKRYSGLASSGRPCAAAAAVALLAAALLLPSLALGQGVLRIAAVVNEDVISAYDLNQRVKMVMITGRVPDNAENRRRLTTQVLRNMIDEQLQLQEAKRLNIRVSDEEIDKLLAKLNAQNNLPPGSLESVLGRAGVDVSALRYKLKADDAWNKIIRDRLQQQVIISDEEVDEELSRLKAVQHLPRHHVAEIFLPVDNPESERQVHELADRLVQQVRDGADFSALAREFSQSASAAVGGDLGWVTKGQLDQEIDRMLAGMSKGQVGGPVQTLAGFHVLLLIDRVVPSSGNNADVTMDYTQMILPLAANATAEEVRSQEARAQQIRRNVENCEDMRSEAAESKAPKSGDVKNVALKDLPQTIRNSVGRLNVGETSEPVRVAEGLFLATLCARHGDAANELPSRQQITQRLGNDRFNLLIQRYMRDLRQTAFVDIRG